MTLDNKQQFWQDIPSATNGLPTVTAWLNQNTQTHQKLLNQLTETSEYWAERQQFISQAQNQYLKQRGTQLAENRHTLTDDITHLTENIKAVQYPWQLTQQYNEYLTDSSKRYFQALDILRERGDNFIEHEKAGCPPVLDYEYEILLDAATFERPCNYVLLQILPPDGVTIDPSKRPYVIIDPRAGHGGGIGGFKHDSQVGVALAGGHAVYFVAFKRKPVPSQTIADVCHAEAQFVQAVKDRHPNAPDPVLIGNCQGGWAILILAATHPEITGPIVLNGSPVSGWSGKVGINPMRYKAGVSGGTWLSMLAADLGNGVFDGAGLVDNFEQLNPSRNYIGKYYDLYKNPTVNRQRFLEFERWWGGFFLMNEAEIHWIVENIFVGNRLARNTAQLETGTNIDIKSIKAPIVIFTSYGDNITPPQQALSWIMDTYSDEREIEICGQRIVYMLHEHVGHLGIFVSSSIANREHKGIATLLDTLEIMPPGLYELVIEDIKNANGNPKDTHFEVNLAPRTFTDLAKIDDGREDEFVFQAVERLSKAQAQSYANFVRPWVKLANNDITAEWQRSIHPLRLQRKLWSSHNPLAKQVQFFSQALPQTTNFAQTQHLTTDKPLSTKTDSQKQLETMTGTNAAANLPAKQSPIEANVFYQAEKLAMDSLMLSMDVVKAWQGFAQESLFFTIWGLPWLRNYGKSETSRKLANPNSLSQDLMVKHILGSTEQGGLAEAIVRVMVLVSKSQGGQVDEAEMAKFAHILKQPPFDTIPQDKLSTIIRDQTIIVRFDENRAIQTLPILLKNPDDRQHAKQILTDDIPKNHSLSEPAQAVLERILAQFSNV